jgi:hypothetical protein
VFHSLRVSSARLFKGLSPISSGVAENLWGQIVGRDLRSLGGFWCRALYLYRNVGDLGEDGLLLGKHQVPACKEKVLLFEAFSRERDDGGRGVARVVVVQIEL